MTTEKELDEILRVARLFGEILRETSEQIQKMFFAVGSILSGDSDAFVRQAAKLERRERYLRRYKRRGERMKTGKTRFHKVRHKRF